MLLLPACHIQLISTSFSAFHVTQGGVFAGKFFVAAVLFMDLFVRVLEWLHPAATIEPAGDATAERSDDLLGPVGRRARAKGRKGALLM